MEHTEDEGYGPQAGCIARHRNFEYFIKQADLRFGASGKVIGNKLSELNDSQGREERDAKDLGKHYISTHSPNLGQEHPHATIYHFPSKTHRVRGEQTSGIRSHVQKGLTMILRG